MNVIDTAETEDFFEVVAGTERSQAATMVLSPGQSTGGPENRHDADQWLYVAAGTGTAIVKSEERVLEPGALVLIETGEAHEIRNDSNDNPLRTVNIYAPPVY